MKRLHSIVGYGGAIVMACALLCAGCASQHAARSQMDSVQSDEQMLTSDSDGIVVSVLPYSGPMERQAFGTALSKRGVMVLEIRFEAADGTELGSGELIRRQDMQLVWADGMSRYPLDPMKVYERNRINPLGGALAFGIVGGMAASSADKSRKTTFADAAIDEIRLDDANRSAGGFLFFDTKGLDSTRPAALKIECEDMDTSKSREIVVNW